MGVANFGGLLMIVTCAFAWVKGDRAERAGALALFASWAGSYLVLYLLGPVWDPHNEWLKTVVQMTGDLLLGIGFLALAILYSSRWLGAVLMVQGAELTLHSIFLGPDRSSVYSYIATSNVFSALLLVMILVGTLASWRRRVLRRRALGRDAPTNWPDLALAGESPALGLLATG